MSRTHKHIDKPVKNKQTIKQTQVNKSAPTRSHKQSNTQLAAKKAEKKQGLLWHSNNQHPTNNKDKQKTNVTEPFD